MRGSDISLTEGTLSIKTTRVTVGGEIVEKGPKSRRGYRVLPLFQPVLGALESLYQASSPKPGQPGLPTRSAPSTTGSCAPTNSAIR